MDVMCAMEGCPHEEQPETFPQVLAQNPVGQSDQEQQLRTQQLVAPQERVQRTQRLVQKRTRAELRPCESQVSVHRMKMTDKHVLSLCKHKLTRELP